MSSLYDKGLNTAPEHGETPIGAFGDGGFIPVGVGSKPTPPSPLGSPTNGDGQGVGRSAGTDSEKTYQDPGDTDNDMDRPNGADDDSESQQYATTNF